MYDKNAPVKPYLISYDGMNISRLPLSTIIPEVCSQGNAYIYKDYKNGKYEYQYHDLSTNNISPYPLSKLNYCWISYCDRNNMIYQYTDEQYNIHNAIYNAKTNQHQAIKLSEYDDMNEPVFAPDGTHFADIERPSAGDENDPMFTKLRIYRTPQNILRLLNH